MWAMRGTLCNPGRRHSAAPPPSPNIGSYIHIYIWICMAYGNELVLEELVICCVAIGTVIQDRRIGKEAVGLGAINSSNRCSR